jgi:hypothetical protein
VFSAGLMAATATSRPRAYGGFAPILLKKSDSFDEGTPPLDCDLCVQVGRPRLLRRGLVLASG